MKVLAFGERIVTLKEDVGAAIGVEDSLRNDARHTPTPSASPSTANEGKLRFGRTHLSRLITHLVNDPPPPKIICALTGTPRASWSSVIICISNHDIFNLYLDD